MRRSIKERFTDRSFMFVLMMTVSVNMFIFVLLYMIDRFLLGHYLEGGIIAAVIMTLFVIPYTLVVKSKKGRRRLTEIMKDDLFLFFFSTTFTFLGLVLLAVYLFERIL